MGSGAILNPTAFVLTIVGPEVAEAKLARVVFVAAAGLVGAMGSEAKAFHGKMFPSPCF